jgi:HEPN domain-containing protein
MKSSTREWVAKAEEDFAVACTLTRPRKKPLWAPVCFHAQQCVEKYLKARLNEASVQFHKTHDLEQLLVQALVVEPL